MFRKLLHIGLAETQQLDGRREGAKDRIDTLRLHQTTHLSVSCSSLKSIHKSHPILPGNCCSFSFTMARCALDKGIFD